VKFKCVLAGPCDYFKVIALLKRLVFSPEESFIPFTSPARPPEMVDNTFMPLGYFFEAFLFGLSAQFFAQPFGNVPHVELMSYLKV
jgi:hypothetical protein